MANARRRIVIGSVALAVIAAAVLLFSDITGRQLIGWFPGFRIRRSKIVTRSEIVLQEAREIFSFNTVEYVYRAIFPFDFMPEDLSINDILRKLRQESGSVTEILSSRELDYFEAYNLAAELGMVVGPTPDQFVVVTVVVTAGFDIAGTVFENPNAFTEAERAQYFRTVEYEDRDGTAGVEAVVRMPEAVITNVTIEDITRDEYPYPDVQINASGWRHITEFVGARITERTIDAGILQTASDNGREFVKNMLFQSGYTKVSFVDGDSADG